MKTPNFRLYDTQARAAILLGCVSLLAVVILAYLVFRGFSFEDHRIYYNAQQGIGRYRPWLVIAGAGMGFLIGITAGLLGFNSLGEKRNNKQGFSWFGVLAGALSIVASLVLFMSWRILSEPIITG